MLITHKKRSKCPRNSFYTMKHQAEGIHFRYFLILQAWTGIFCREYTLFNVLLKNLSFLCRRHRCLWLVRCNRRSLFLNRKYFRLQNRRCDINHFKKKKLLPALWRSKGHTSLHANRVWFLFINRVNVKLFYNVNKLVDFTGSKPVLGPN